MSAIGSDAEGDDFEYSWTATAGSFEDAGSMQTIYTCETVSGEEITIEVSDDGFEYCIDAWTVPVDCVDGDGGTGGTGGSGGSAGSGGSGGTGGGGGVKPVALIVINADGVRVEPIPGPSAMLAALVVSALPPYPFTFAGFPPRTAAWRFPSGG